MSFSICKLTSINTTIHVFHSSFSVGISLRILRSSINRLLSYTISLILDRLRIIPRYVTSVLVRTCQWLKGINGDYWHLLLLHRLHWLHHHRLLLLHHRLLLLHHRLLLLHGHHLLLRLQKRLLLLHRLLLHCHGLLLLPGIRLFNLDLLLTSLLRISLVLLRKLLMLLNTNHLLLRLLLKCHF